MRLVRARKLKRLIANAVFEGFFGQDPTTIQTIILKKSNFNNTSARKWASGHGFKNSKVDETSTSFRFRQFEPSACKNNSFRTVSLRKGVSAVVCRKR